MNNELLERVAKALCAAEAYPARDWREWTDMAAAVLAEMAGEMRDCERYRWIRAINAFDKSAPQPPSGDWWNCVLSEKINDDFDKAIDEARHD